MTSRDDLASLLESGDNRPERLAKRLASAGLCSRRDAEKWIVAGRVKVDGEVIATPAINVTADNRVTVDGKALPPRGRPRLWRYYKPRGLVVSHRDEQERRTVFEEISKSHGRKMPRVISVGRLDLNSEGLLLLTDSGALARHFELPATGLRRQYRARVYGKVDTSALSALAEGITIDRIVYRPIKAQLDRTQGDNAWLTIELIEGKNREIRHVMEHLGYPVNRLIRISFGAFTLDDLKVGQIEEVRPEALLVSLGLKKLTEEKKGHAHHQRQKARGDNHRPKRRQNSSNK